MHAPEGPAALTLETRPSEEKMTTAFTDSL
jgi:hypothetical protein